MVNAELGAQRKSGVEHHRFNLVDLFTIEGFEEYQIAVGRACLWLDVLIWLLILPVLIPLVEYGLTVEVIKLVIELFDSIVSCLALESHPSEAVEVQLSVNLSNIVLSPLVVDLLPMVMELLEELELSILVLLAELLQSWLVVSDHEELDGVIGCGPPPRARLGRLAAGDRRIRFWIFLEDEAALPLDWIVLLLNEGPLFVLVNQNREQD